MTIEVKTYGSVIPSFQNLVTEILENVSKDMPDYPPKCYLHICRTKEDFLNYDRHEREKISRVLDQPVSEEFSAQVIGTYYIFDYPEIFMVEDIIEPDTKSLEQLEGNVAHEAGHARDFYKYGKISLSQNPTPLGLCVNKMKNEFEAENNALNVGYCSGILCKNTESIKRNTKFKENINFSGFFANLSVASLYAAFMQNKKPPLLQKRKTEEIFNKFGESRTKPGRLLFQSKELKEHPEKFGDESFLEDFIFQKHYDWNISFI